MSTLEKATQLLQKLPENKLEAVYVYMRFVDAQIEPDKNISDNENSTMSAFGIAHEYANPALINREEGAFERAMAEKTCSWLTQM